VATIDADLRFDLCHAVEPLESRMTEQTWPHPYAEVTRAGTTVTAALLPGIGEGLRDVARILSIAGRLGRCDCASVAIATDVAIDPTHGRIVITTKGCPGQSADRLRAAGAIPIARVARIVAAVIDALRAAHGIGVLHRALSLASVVIDGEDVRVLDFGLGDLFVPDSPHAELRLLALTPERIIGLPAAATEDIYLVGCVAYHLVSGDPPLVDDDAAHLRRRHAIEDPPRL
jgi:serine/threonine protein kinase